MDYVLISTLFCYLALNGSDFLNTKSTINTRIKL